MRGIGRAVRRTTAICLLSAAMFAGPAQAAEDDTQLWLYANTVIPLGDDASATFELSPRFREGGDQLLVRGTAELKLSPEVTVGGGAAYVEFADGHEFRPHQQLTLTFGPVALRSRVEERFFAGADRMQLRLRQRIQLATEVAPGTRLSGSAELLYIARTEDPADDARVDSWRFQAVAQHRFSKRVEAGLGYLLIYSPRAGAPDRVSHVPQISLVVRP